MSSENLWLAAVSGTGCLFWWVARSLEMRWFDRQIAASRKGATDGD